MKKILTACFTLCSFLVFSNQSFSQATHTVLVGPDGSYIFDPANLTISVGDTVRWEWKSDFHSTSSDATEGNEVWDSGILDNGAVYSRAFKSTGTYAYHCTPHKSLGMVGSITVVGTTGTGGQSEFGARKLVLNQNHPNPFNLLTEITYSIINPDYVSLKIYDIQGKEVRDLVHEFQTENTYSVKVDASDLPYGIYFYKLQVSHFTEVKKMVVQQ